MRRSNNLEFLLAVKAVKTLASTTAISGLPTE